MTGRDPIREEAEKNTLSLLYDVFLILRPEAWRSAEPAGITPTQAAILTVVCSSRRRLSISDIARRLRCSRPTVSRSVANLEGKSYVRRTPCRQDRRRVLVMPADAAWDAASRAPKWDYSLPVAFECMALGRLDNLREALADLHPLARQFNRRRGPRR